MKIANIIKRIVFPNKYSSEAYIRYLRSKGITIGDGCIIYSPNTTSIDAQRPHMLTIGNYVKITAGVHIICHDYSRSVLMNMPGYENVGEASSTHIGDNVFIGVNSIILMGSHIGNNSIVGAGAVVSGHFEDNSVIAGNPAKKVCSIEDFYEKRKQKELYAAKEYVKCWRLKYNRDPSIYEMTNAFSWLYLERSHATVEKHERLFRMNGIDNNIVLENFYNSKPLYGSFEEFLKDCE